MCPPLPDLPCPSVARCPFPARVREGRTNPSPSPVVLQMGFVWCCRGKGGKTPALCGLGQGGWCGGAEEPAAPRYLACLKQQGRNSWAQSESSLRGPTPASQLQPWRGGVFAACLIVLAFTPHWAGPGSLPLLWVLSVRPAWQHAAPGERLSAGLAAHLKRRATWLPAKNPTSREA